MANPEKQRLKEDAARAKNWKRWGPYLSERQWGTVREDYSPDGSCWDYFPHDHARSRAYRWGEDGLLGISDRECRLCFALALWNRNDPILKERLFGLTGPEGNHGEDVKECYYYLDSTPTHSYMKALYKYPQTRFPYNELVAGNRTRSKTEGEFELADTGIFNDNRYFDVSVEYAKGGPNDILIRVTAVNRGPQPAPLHILPTLWFRNTWSWGRSGEGYWPKPSIKLADKNRFHAQHTSLGSYSLFASPQGDHDPEPLLTENETNIERLMGKPNASLYVKDAFHQYLIGNKKELATLPAQGTKAAFHYVLHIPAGESRSIELRLSADEEAPKSPFDTSYSRTFSERLAEADEYYNAINPPRITAEEAAVMRQSNAGLLWSKQFYYYAVNEWLQGDPAQPAPPATRAKVRNSEWQHLYNRDVISMPDKWEYPWYAAWDLAFHMVSFCKIDPDFAKEQLVLFMREWYMHPNGQIPAYEFAFSDVNPPVHAWACWRVYKITAPRGERDRVFLARCFQKLLINFTWWINRKDVEGNNLFGGGFLGLDNIGVFDRSRPLPTGGRLEQADATAWMAFYCGTMLSMALELAAHDPSYEDLASKFFEHFVAITDAINSLGGTGLWDQLDGFYYDQLHIDNRAIPLRIRSMVGIIPLFAVEVLEEDVIERLPGFKKRMNWFMQNRGDLARHISYMEHTGPSAHGHRLLAVPSRDRLLRVLRYVLDENEFLSPHGLRSLSKVHKSHPYVFHAGSEEYRVDYTPGESTTALFGGNSNWRGPVWFPLNYLLIEALQKYHHFYGDSLLIEYPTGSGKLMDLKGVAVELATRLAKLFMADDKGARPCHGGDPRYVRDPAWRDLILFHEYFHGDNGQGLGASHQTGWTALVSRCIEQLVWERAKRTPGQPYYV